MYAEVDVFISNYTLVDPDIYQLWTEGYSCKHCIFSEPYLLEILIAKAMCDILFA